MLTRESLKLVQSARYRVLERHDIRADGTITAPLLSGSVQSAIEKSACQLEPANRHRVHAGNLAWPLDTRRVSRRVRSAACFPRVLGEETVVERRIRRFHTDDQSLSATRSPDSTRSSLASSPRLTIDRRSR